MNNVSLKGEDLFLSLNTEYLVIDALYLNDIRKSLNEVDIHSLQDIQQKVFPYNDFPFGVVNTGEDRRRIIMIKNIKKETYSNMGKTKGVCYFSSDTGLLVVVAMTAFVEFTKSFDYDQLLDTLTENFNAEYWMKINSHLKEGDVGLIFSPGLRSGFEFDGGGTYSLRVEA